MSAELWTSSPGPLGGRGESQASNLVRDRGLHFTPFEVNEVASMRCLTGFRRFRLSRPWRP